MSTYRFPYGRQQFAINLLLLLILLVLLPLMLLSVGEVDAVIMVGFSLLVLALLAIFGISPMLTAHEIDGDRLILRQGLQFKAVIPMRNIRDMRRVDAGPRRTGTWARTFGSTLYVTTRRYDLIQVRLKERQRFPWAMWKEADVVVFDTIDNLHLIRKMEGSGITLASPALGS